MEMLFFPALVFGMAAGAHYGKEIAGDKDPWRLTQIFGGFVGGVIIWNTWPM
jgi:hypothetical protein